MIETSPTSVNHTRKSFLMTTVQYYTSKLVACIARTHKVPEIM